MLWKWIEGGIAMLTADLGTWPNIVGIEEKESELEMVRNWNIGRNGREREIMNK